MFLSGYRGEPFAVGVTGFFFSERKPVADTPSVIDTFESLRKSIKFELCCGGLSTKPLWN